MKKLSRVLIIFVFILIIFVGKVNAHGGNITGWKDKDSSKITLYNGNAYGYHNENGVRHYHQVEWSEEKQKWEILKSAVYYDEEFNIVQRHLDTDSEKIEVQLYNAVDGDTADFKLNGEVIRARFLGINTPETVASNVPVEKWGPEASAYTKKALQNATKIQVEYDEKASKTDMYDRHLVWVWVDDELLQEQLVVQGFTKEYMLQSNYRYADIIQEAESIAKSNKVGLWSDEQETINEINDNKMTEQSIIVLIGTFVLGIISILVKKVNRKSKRK